LFVVEERTPPVTYSERRNDLRLPLAVLAEARNDHLLQRTYAAITVRPL